MHFTQHNKRESSLSPIFTYIYGMELFTKVATPKASFKIDYTSHIAFFGSCFADNISSQFANRKFHTLANPFGTVYNPVSMARQVKAIASGKVFGEEDVFQDARCDRLWHCFDAHSSLSASSREECIEKLNAATTQAREFLQKADVVFITLGTAFVYFLKSTGDAVSNCHRQDPSLFERRMVPVEESARALESIVQNLRMICADTRIVFTVSPLRHMADGAHENSLSKATLQLAINKTGAEYFPSYEIVIDELRDYRFTPTTWFTCPKPPRITSSSAWSRRIATSAHAATSPPSRSSSKAQTTESWTSTPPRHKSSRRSWHRRQQNSKSKSRDYRCTKKFEISQIWRPMAAFLV